MLLILGIMSLIALVAGALVRVDASEAAVVPEPPIRTHVHSLKSGSNPDDPPSSSAAVPWRAHFFAVPGSDGTSLFVSTGQMAELDAAVTAEARVVGQAWRRHSMTYSTEENAYETLISGIFVPGTLTDEGEIALTAALDSGDTLDTGPIHFRRFFVPTTGAAPIVSGDNNLEMTLTDDSLPVDAYALVMTANSVPGPMPLGHQLVGQPYSVRASGAIITSTRPMLLKLFYTDTTLGDLDPHTLSVLQWDPVSMEWDDSGGNLDDVIENSVSTTTDRFTVYTLMSTIYWRDAFNDFTGLSEWDHVSVLLPDGELVLDGLAYTGAATSRPITPTVSIDCWGHVYFTKTVPAGTSLTVDVLSADGTALLSDMTSGADLAAIDPIAYPRIELRAMLSTDDPAHSARLDEWMVTWQPKLYEAYLPLVFKGMEQMTANGFGLETVGKGSPSF